MRIGMVAQSLSRAGGGVSEAMRMLGNAVLAQGEGHALHVFAAADSWSGADAEAYAGWTVHVTPAFGPRRFRFSPAMVREMVAADLDVVHVHGIWQAHGLAALLWRMRTRRPMVLAPHGMIEPWILARSPRAKRAMSGLFQDRLFRGAAAIHALTDTERAQAAHLYPRNRNPVVIPNYVEPPGCPGDAKPEWWHAGMEGRRIYLFLGRLHSKKGILELCAAWDAACAASPQFAGASQLVLCGWIDDLPDLPAVVSALAERHANILYAGPQFGAGKWRSLAAADMVLLPSKSEGLPMGVLEAWSVGVPVIMTRACNLDEGFAMGAAIECGTSAEAIRQALSAASNLPAAALREKSARARDLVARRFSREMVANRLVEVYRDVIGTAEAGTAGVPGDSRSMAEGLGG